MSNNYLLKSDGSFIIKDYNRTAPFSNFLPGIAGVWGVPMWVFYVNRGQAVSGFGIKDKEHSIGEFFPANKAYWLTSGAGFRTFLKINKTNAYESFLINAAENVNQSMIINSDSLQIKDDNSNLGINTSVKYYTLANTPLAGLVRVLTLKNTSDKNINLDVLDGISRIVPFGTGDFFLKHMARTIEAWMRSYLYDNLAVFRLIVDPADVSETKYVDGANFSFSFYPQDGKDISPYLVVDPQVLFGHDTSYVRPIKFFDEDFKAPVNQITCGKMPCSFSYFNWDLAPGEEKSFYSIFGASFKLDLIKKTVKSFTSKVIAEKEKENKKIIENVKNETFCVSGQPEFDEYTKNTYLDNVLRGGYPYSVEGSNNIYYIFSRKHGDLERDYNRFHLLPSYFSEGEANYRDINQNRRMDLFFNPFIGRGNIAYFMSLLRMDGYNPLVVKGEKLLFNKTDAEGILDEFKIKDSKLLDVMRKGFHLGEFFKILEEEQIKVKDRGELAKDLVGKAKKEPNASFGEGFWIDHWTYNLDLIDSYLYIYPDKLKELFLTKDITCWDDHHRVRKRDGRYCVKDGKVFQSYSVEFVADKKKLIDNRIKAKNFLYTKSGRVFKVTLVEKLIILILNKCGSLDPAGLGIEMEAGKPGWCDSLNGLPALFGSSVCEVFELKRACVILKDALAQLKKKKINSIELTTEVASFYMKIEKMLKEYLSSTSARKDYLWWDKANSVKEDFRKKTFYSVSDGTKKVKTEKILNFLEEVIKKINIGIKKAKDKNSGISNTYFRYQVKKFKVKKKIIQPTEFEKKPLPLFLEGPMHALRVDGERAAYQALKNTDLFDKELKMYRLNSSLGKEPLEIGRSRIFVPGWLENESIWMHMEYKYLLEVLKNGLYKEFFQDFRNCCVCFFDPQKYGRNILENSSFIVSSAYPDKSLWGKGFVARLSGATAEFLNMWILLVLGKQPFTTDESNNLRLTFSPILTAEMFTQKDQVIKFNGQDVTINKDSFAFKLFSKTLVVYHNPKRKNTFEDNCRVNEIIVESEGKKHKINSGVIEAPLSNSIRQVKADRIDVYFE
ncbi:MAG: hypothetical protein ABIH71_07885 [Candidatus Omnitrophota bacterium]|nr:hypothetical protein [Candidatus Omnitrophota bacterium]